MTNDKDKQEFFDKFDYLGRNYQPLDPTNEFDWEQERIEEVWSWIETKRKEWQRKAYDNGYMDCLKKTIERVELSRTDSNRSEPLK